MGVEKEGKKRIGRFIKQNDPILDYMNVTDFRLVDVNKFNTLVPDNPINTVIHTKLHTPGDVERAIKPYQYDDNDITPKEGKRPVLIPLDFTADWERMRARSSRKQVYLDDEDFFFLEAFEKNSKKSDSDANDEDDDNEGMFAAENAAAASDSDASETQSGLPHSEAPFPANDQLARENELLSSVASALPQDSDQFQGTGLVVGTAVNEEPLDEFASPPSTTTSEDQQQPFAEIELTEEDINQIKEQGFQEGFDLGHKEAEQQVKESFQKDSAKIGNLINELQNLKKDVLQNAHENFMAVSKSLVEALLKKEFKANPEALSNIIQQAVDEMVPQDQFQVKLHPNLYDKLIAQAPEDLKAHLTADDSMNEFDFKVESNQGIVDGKLTQIISDLLEQAGINLFEESQPSDEAS